MCSAFCVSHIQHFLGKLIIFLNLLPPPMAKAMLSPPTGLSVYLSVCLCVCQSVCIFCLQKFTLFNLLILCFYVESFSGWRGCECRGGVAGLRVFLATLLRNVSINFDGFNLDPDIFSCDHTVLETLPSVRLSDCPSVCLSHIVTVIMKFSGVITIDKSDVPAKGQGQWSNAKVIEDNTILSQFGLFRTITQVWIHRWIQTDAQSLECHRRGAPLLGILTRIERFQIVILVWIHRWLQNAQS